MCIGQVRDWCGKLSLYYIMLEMKEFTSKSQKVGEIGEEIACTFLIKKGFKVIERNYTKPWGEIDIVTIKDKKIHFVEVKSVMHNTWDREDDLIRPEDNMTKGKQQKLARVVSLYIAEHDIHDWQFDLVSVFIEEGTKKSKVRILENIIFDL